MGPLIDQRIGSYRITRRIGAGGMGEVYEAVHVQIGHLAVIKVLHPHRALTPGVAERFLQEARAANRVQHPGIVRVHEWGQLDDGRAYLVMEHLEGETLAERLAKKGPAAPLVGLLRQAASALAEVHGRGVVHRDLKPSNIMICRDPEMPSGERAKILDFGIAKDLAREADGAPHTDSDVVLGTPLYMAPEQCRGAGRVDDRADVYSLGCILYELLCGSPPFHGAGQGEIIGLHLHAPPPPLSGRAPGAGRRMVTLVHAMLDKDRDERPTMQEVAETLAELDGAGGAADAGPRRSSSAVSADGAASSTLDRAPAASVRAARSSRRSPLLFVGALTLLVGGFLALALAVADGGAGAGRRPRASGDLPAIAPPAVAAPPAAVPVRRAAGPHGILPAIPPLKNVQRTKRPTGARSDPAEAAHAPDQDYVPEIMLDDPPPRPAPAPALPRG